MLALCKMEVYIRMAILPHTNCPFKLNRIMVMQKNRTLTMLICFENYSFRGQRGGGQFKKGQGAVSPLPPKNDAPGRSSYFIEDRPGIIERFVRHCLNFFGNRLFYHYNFSKGG